MMDQRTRDALEASIKHWQENVAAEAACDARMGPTFCALCVQFNVYEDDEKNCIGCPVRGLTGRGGCVHTPYQSACDAHSDWSFFEGDDVGRLQKRDLWRVAAQAELDFLISLRSSDGTDEVAADGK